MSGALQSIYYDTDQFGFDCLHYFSTEFYFSEIVKYCIHPTDDKNSTIVEFMNISDHYLTFDELHRLNVTSHEVLLWSSSIDLAEQYQYYLDQPIQSNLSNEKLFNCTFPWFGSRCQYSFELNDVELVENSFEMDLTDDVFHRTCYILLECDRGGSSICLDWREICDGRIDCLNDGVDEMQCFVLEINECDENEYRCHNGMCIPKIFSEMESVEGECLDRSDLSFNSECLRFYFKLYLFECEEHVCRPDQGKFLCGDGQCVEDFAECDNNRHLSLIQSISGRGNLPYECWITMVCLSKIVDEIENVSCEQFIQSTPIIEQMKSCEYPLEFPTIPVLLGHVRFLYHPKEIHNINVTLALKPDYICYDEQLCDFLTPTFHHKTLTCRDSDQMGFVLHAELTTWKSIIDTVKPFFDGCITQRYRSIDIDLHYSSLYRCKNSSKYISNHRIVDGISDCFLNDDEEAFQLSCLLNDISRFQCPSENQCRSPLFSHDICSFSIQTNHDDISFDKICDRIVDLPMMLTGGRNQSDETDCEHWQCNNIYTRCDGFWNCVHGEDEENCTQPTSSTHFLFCVSSQNYTLMCLPANPVDNGIVDCFGASDELQYSRMDSVAFQKYRFRCWNDTKCVDDENLCNGRKDCPMHDNEPFCASRPQLCDDSDFDHLIDVPYILCRIINTRQAFFSLETASIYPSSPTIQINSVQNEINDTEIESSLKNFTRPDICNNGLHVYHRLGVGNYSSLCFCPPNYYGDRCQYQNQRVSLTLSLASADQHFIYAVVVTLFEEDDDKQEIHSYHQLIHVSTKHCGKSMNMYLLYLNRGKNNSKNYSVRIDVFDKSSLTYLMTSYLTIPFVFLPVNRLAAFVTLPFHQTFNPSHCTLQCYKGDCIKYHNKERFFCRCHPGWSGAQCHIPIDCSMCVSNSFCIGSIRNRSICVCPHGKFGSFCRLELACPIRFCENNGRCVVIDERMITDSYMCFCSEPFFGTRCELVKHRVEISFRNIKILSYLLAYIYTEIAFEQPIPILYMLRKMTMFQSSVTLYSQHMYQMVLVKIDIQYYLAVLQKFESSNISTSISPAQRCVPIHELFSSDFLSLPRIHRLKNYHLPCQYDFNLQCFVDEFYMCLCTEEHHSNCFPIDHKMTFVCHDNVYCENGGTCLQDRPMCPFSILCVCVDCFFGDRCQFYAKGIGLTLDDLLRYEIRPNSTLNDQSLVVKLSVALIMVVFVAGLLNSFLCYQVFRNPHSRKVGSGIYLQLSSIISILVVTMLVIKFWFVIYTHMNQSISRNILQHGCVLFEPMLRLFLHMSNWLNACVAIERAVAVFKGISFNKKKSKCIARWTLCLLPFIILSSMSHELIYRDLFDDYEERRVWCVLHYSRSTERFSTVVQFLHFVVPFSANLFSALFIIFNIARQRSVIRTQLSYEKQLLDQFNEHKQLVISPIVTVVLLVPRFLISLLSGCVKTSRNPGLYIFGYFVSFIPSSLIFVIFVLPSSLYKRQFKESMITLQQRFMKM